MRRWTLLLLGSLIVAPTAAISQQTVDLPRAFVPDPRIAAVLAGGRLSIADELKDSDCDYGYIADAGLVSIDIADGGSSDLYVYAEGEGDIMLLILTPSGARLCDDDSHEGLNPLLRLSAPAAGVYSVWVGSYAEGETHNATLYLSRSAPGGGSSPGVPNLSLDATYGSVSLSAPFSTDPHTVSISAGGSVDVDVTGCGYGFVAMAPDYDLTYTGSGGTLYFFVRSDEDTTLLINKPDASWICDDDSLGDSNPVVTIPNAPSGLYDIWVGTYSDGDLASATLYISTKGAK